MNALNRAVLSAACALSLTGCQTLNDLISPPSESERLQREIELEQKKQQLEQLRNQNQATPLPTATASPPGPISTNQSPQIGVLDAVLASTSRNNDTVRIIVKASDADGDPLEYNWTSVYTGLSSTKGDSVVWYPTADLKGKTNIITVSVSDKKGGTSTASLNVFVQNDGTLLVREDTANKPVLGSLLATRTDDGRVLLRANASDPAGGVLSYQWTSSAGQLSTPAAAASLWQSDGSAGAVGIRLLITAQSGLRTEGSFRFERRADGQLIGGFTGTDIAAPSTGQLVNAAPGEQVLQTVGDLLVLEDQDLVRSNPSSRTRTTLLRGSEIPLPEGVSSQRIEKLISDGSKSYLIVLELRGRQPATRALYRLDPSLGTASRESALPENLKVLDLQADFSNSQYYVSSSGVRALVRLTGTGPNVGYWLIDSLGQTQGRIPQGSRPLAVSAQGKVLVEGSNGTLLSYDPDTGLSTPLLDPAVSNLQRASYGQVSWNHKGDAVVFSQDATAAGGQEGGTSLYLLSLDGRLKKLANNKLQTTLKSVSFSLDDLYVSFIEYPYVYLQSPSDRRSRLGKFGAVAIDRPEQPIMTRLEFSENHLNQMTWIP